MRRAKVFVGLCAFLAIGAAADRSSAEVLSSWSISGNAPSGLSWQSIASGTAMPVVVNAARSATAGAYALWNVRTGALQLNPNGLNLNSFSLVYTSGTATVSATTSGPLRYPQGTSPTSLQVSGTASAADQRALPAGTWNSVTVWGARVGGVIARTPTGTPTLSTSGANTASSNGWLNQTWTFPSTLVSSGSAAAMTVSDWRTQGVSGNPNANVAGWGDYQGTFQYTLSGTSAPGTQVGPVVPVGLASLEWSGSDGTWNHASANWTDSVTHSVSTFYNLDSVAFTGAAGGAVTIAGTESPGAFAISAESGTYTFGGGSIGGYANLAKSGQGTAVFAVANAWSGGTTLSAGTIRAGNDAALGTGTIALDGGTIASTGATSRTFANPVSVGGDVTIGDRIGTGAVTFSGGVNLGGANRTVTTVADTTLSGAVSNGSLTKAGAGTLSILGSASLSGTTAVDAGTLTVAPGGTLSSSDVTVASGATLSVMGLVQTFGGSLVVDGTLSGVGSVEGPTTIRGVHGPGTSDPSAPTGSQTFLGDLFYEQAGITAPQVNWRLDANTSVFQAGTTFDKIVVQNDLLFGTTTNVEMTFDGQGSSVAWDDPFWSTDQAFVLYEVGGVTTGANRLRVAPSQGLFDSSGKSLSSVRPDARFGIQKVGQNMEVVYYATPEPSTWAMAAGAAGVAGLAGWRRRQRRRRAPDRPRAD